MISLLSNNSVGNVKQILILKVEYFYFSKDVDVRVGSERTLSVEELMLLNCGAGEDS